MDESALGAEDKLTLLRWARRAVETVVSGGNDFDLPDAPVTEALQSRLAAFVTLKKQGALRGCIGKMDFERPLWENVVGAAVAAAVEDPRFPPLQREELPEVRLEISVLDAPVNLPRVEQFDPQRHGIMIERGWRRGLLLPKVAREFGWDAAQTLAAVCTKAGLPPDAWQQADARLQIFTTCDFAETEKKPVR